MIKEILKILAEALLLGLVSPWIILRVSRKREENRFEKDRRLDVFRNLLRRPIYSADDLTEEFVGLLNLVYIDFSGCNKVIEARKEFQKLVTRGVAGDQRVFDQEFQIQRAVLLKTMAAELGITISEIDIMHGQYYPEHFKNISKQRNELDNALLAVLKGDQSIHVTDINSDYHRERYRQSRVFYNLSNLDEGEVLVIRQMVLSGENIFFVNTNNIEEFQSSYSLFIKNILEPIYEAKVETSYYRMPSFVWEKVKDDPRFK